jgi:hypothetical protein
MSTLKSFVIAFVVFALLVAFASPALAASNDRLASISVCTYGYVQSLNPKTQVITVRCRTWAEWQALQAQQSIGNAIKSAQGTYERKVTLPVSKAGTKAAAPVVTNKTVQNTWWLLRQGGLSAPERLRRVS